MNPLYLPSEEANCIRDDNVAGWAKIHFLNEMKGFFTPRDFARGLHQQKCCGALGVACAKFRPEQVKHGPPTLGGLSTLL